MESTIPIQSKRKNKENYDFELVIHNHLVMQFVLCILLLSIYATL